MPVEAESKCCAFQRLTSAGVSAKDHSGTSNANARPLRNLLHFCGPLPRPRFFFFFFFFHFSPPSTCRPTLSPSQTAASSCRVPSDPFMLNIFSSSSGSGGASQFRRSSSSFHPLQFSSSSSLTTKLCYTAPRVRAGPLKPHSFIPFVVCSPPIPTSSASSPAAVRPRPLRRLPCAHRTPTMATQSEPAAQWFISEDCAHYGGGGAVRKRQNARNTMCLMTFFFFPFSSPCP